jgi:hypothetical protein
MIELLPCPFCGHAPEQDKTMITEGHYIYRIACENNECLVNPVTDGNTSFDGAAASWNPRA